MVRKASEEYSKGYHCQWREVMDLVGDKWSMMIVQTLCHQQLRYSEIYRAIDGISQKMLTSTLRQLERDGIVRRTVHPVVPPKVEYELTALGHSVFEIVDTLKAWSIEHLDDVKAARAAYDARQLPKMAPAATIQSVTGL